MAVALEPAHALRTPRSGYRAVRYLNIIMEMTKKVLQIVQDSEAAI